MLSPAKSLQKPRLLFAATIERQLYWRRFRLALILLLTVLAAWAALEVVSLRGDITIPPNTLDIGRLAAVFVTGLLLVRLLVHFWRWRTRHDEQIKIYDQGFSWLRKGQTHKYSWNKLVTLREAGRGIYLGKRPLVQWGSYRLTMTDKQVFVFKPYHGDMRAFIRAVRPYAADVTGTRMGRILRQEKPVRLHPQLVAWPGGLAVGKKELHWSLLDVEQKGDKLIIRARNPKNGKYQTVRRFPVSRVDNAAGFVELATTTIENHR